MHNQTTTHQLEEDLKTLNILAEKYGYDLIEKERYLLAEFSASSYSSSGSTAEKMIITEEEKRIIETSALSLRIDLPSGYYTCGSDDSYSLKKEDFQIAGIGKEIKNYLEEEYELEDNGYIREFINKSKGNM